MGVQGGGFGFEDGGGLRECGVGRGAAEVGFYFVLLFADGLEEEDVAVDVDVGFGDRPDAGGDLAAFDVEGAALVHAAEEAVAEFDVVDELALDGLDAVLGLV